MQTPKSRVSSGGSAPQRASPRAVSTEASRKNSPRSGGSSDVVTEKVSPRVVRQLKASPHYTEPTDSSSNLATRASKGSPKLGYEKKNQSKVGELESQISVLKNDLKVVKDQLSATEELKKQAELDAEESNQKLLALSLKLVESQKQLIGQSDESSEILEKRSDVFVPEIENEQVKNAHEESYALASALDEVKRLKEQIEIEAESKARHLKQTEDEENEIQEVKQSLSETLMLIEDMKNQLREAKESELHAHEVVRETTEQLEMAKKIVETLKVDGIKAFEAYNAIVSELNQSKTHVDSLEEFVKKGNDHANEKLEMDAVKIEVEHLRSALEAAEIRYNEEKARSSDQARNAVEMIEKIKTELGQRETELELELRSTRREIDELRANMMDKETELQGICEENESLAMKLEKTMLGVTEPEHEKEVQDSKMEVDKLRVLLMEKGSLLKNVCDENEKLKVQIEESIRMREITNFEPEEFESQMKISQLSEEIDKSNKMAARVSEQLQAAQATRAEMEAELRRVKIQSDQWRKAAEAAAAMVSAGNNGQLMERTGSMGSHFSPRMGTIESPYADDLDDELMKKKNPNMLTRLWKRPHK